MPTSAEIKTTLVTRLIAKAVVTQQEAVYAEVGSLLDEGYIEHLPDAAPNYTALEVRDYELVLLLGWERICLSRASFYAPQPSLNMKSGAPGFGSDRDTPFEKNTKLATLLRKRYETLRSAISENSDDDDDTNPSGDIFVGELIRHDDILGVNVPISAAPAITSPTAALGAISGNTAVVSWTGTKHDEYADTRVLLSNTAGIYQNWNSDGTNGVPYASSTSTVAFTTIAAKGRAIKLTGLVSGTYYLVVVVRSLVDDYAYSNELTFTIP